MDIKYVLFDLDGTLTDPEVGITRCVAYALDSFGIHVENTSELRKFIGPPLKDSFMEFYGFSEKDALTAVDKYRERFSAIGIFENKPYYGIGLLLRELHEHDLTLAVSSSKPEVFTVKIIEHFGLDKYFTHICGSLLDGNRTAKKDVIAHTLRCLGNPNVNDVIMVGDRKYDIEGAATNSIKSIGVLYGFGGRDELETAGANYIAETIPDIKNIIVNN